jgi:hypothetical protein
VLACEDGAVLSHRIAAVLWGLLEERWNFVDITTPRRGRKGTEGIRLHRTRRLEGDEIAIVRAIPVEVDGHATHGTRFAFEDDRARDLALVRAGWRVVRFTHAQIAFDAPEVAVALRDLLGLGPLALV